MKPRPSTLNPQPSRIVISGASGFVGANLVRYCLERGHQAHVLLRNDYNPWRLKDIESQITLHTSDLSNQEELTKQLQQIQPDWVFHLAAYGAYSWQDELDQIMQTNFFGTVNLIQAAIAAKVKVLVNTGSSSEYGYKDHAPLESELVEPNSHYAIAKAAATHYCQYIANHTKKICIPTLRLYNVYGPWEESQRLVPNLIKHGLEGKLPPLVDPTIARDFVYVDDVCEAYLAAAQRFSSLDPQPSVLAPVYNIGTGTQTTLAELVELVRELLDLKVQPEWGSMPNRRWDTNVWFSNPTKAETELEWRARTKLGSGLRQVISWHQLAS